MGDEASGPLCTRTPNCTSETWTSHRFSRAVIDAYHYGLNILSQQHTGASYDLIGFSGGGAIATIVAAERKDVNSLRTVAGNLDHRAVNAYHRVSPLTGSLNPIDITFRLTDMPQIHFIGAKDEIVPSWISKAFIDALGETTCARMIKVTGNGHTTGWVDFWKANIKVQPRCR